MTESEHNDPPVETTPDVLVVEDDETIALGIVRCLEMEFNVRHAPTGEAGLEAAQAHLPDLVVLDWMLPGIDGMEVLRSLKRDHPAVPVILLTARTSENDRIRGLDAGADDYVVKPFSVKELAARVRARLRARPLSPERTGQVEFGNVKVDLRHRILRKAGVEKRLTTHVPVTGNWQDIGATAARLIERDFPGKAVLSI